MPESASHPPRPLSGSRSLQVSQFFPGTPSSSRPFLNMLNPLGRTYQGYTQANQSLVEEDDENRYTDEDLEAGQAHGQSDIFQEQSTSKSHGKRRVSWDAASQMNVLRPNIHQEDKIHENESSDDEVPQSFMIEAARQKPSKGKGTASMHANRRQPLHSISGRKVPPIDVHAHGGLPPSVSIPPGPSEVSGDDDKTPKAPHNHGTSEHSDHVWQPKQMRGLDAYERALWNWVNVYNLDAFLQEVYHYYEGKGIYSIALARGLNLLTVGFVIGFSTFLLGCVDYSRIRPEGITRLSDVVVGRCLAKFSGFTFMFFLLFTAFYVWQIISFILDVVRLIDMYNFYTHLLRIPDEDIQTISWPEIVRRIGSIREENPLTAISSTSKTVNNAATAKLDAHDIASRIMRQENYLIAMFNKELLDLRVPLPSLIERLMGESGRRRVASEIGTGKMLTRALEWNLRFCLMEYLFDHHGKVRKVFLKSRNRTALIEGLKRRFIFMGILNAIFAPFIVLYLLMYSFFRYFEEYRKNPSSIGGRRYTPFAHWKFREFNELPHLFARRLDESYPAASMYIGQFPNEKMTLIMRFLAFIAGSFAAVLVVASVLDPDLFLHFEITPHGTVLFYIGVFGSALAVLRGMIPDDNRVFDPELLMMEVISYTHYMPDSWKDQLHSKKVHQEFGELFAMKVLIFVQELLSVVLTPFVLWYSLPACAPVIIDFFRDFSVHVDGMGYVCSFAEFNFQRHGNVKFGAPMRIHDKRMVSNQGKMEKSFLNFKAANPDWNPTDPSGSLYLSRMADFSAAQSHRPYSHSRRRPPVAGMESAMGGTVLLSERKKEVALADRAQEYDRALRQSQHTAATRKRQGGSVIAGTGSPVGGISSIYHSGIGGMSMAQTAVLGDSHGSVTTAPLPAMSDTDDIPDEDLAPDGVGSGLGGSYVDGGKRPKAFVQDNEDEELEDGGVLGLLAQIYGGRGLQR